MASERSEAAQQPMDAAPVALSSPEAAAGLSRLRRFLAAHRGHFALALVRASQEDVKDELFGWTKGFCDAEKLKCIRIDQGSEDDEAFLGRIAGLAQADTVYLLTGTDRAINVGADGQLARLLNRQRERLAEWMPGPVLLVLGDLAMDRFLVEAPDLADWHAAVFAFERKAGMIASSAFAALAEAGFAHGSEVSTETIEARLSTLEQQVGQRFVACAGAGPDLERTGRAVSGVSLFGAAGCKVPAQTITGYGYRTGGRGGGGGGSALSPVGRG